MIIHKLKIENVDYNLNNIRYYFLDNYPKTIHLFLIGSWYKIYNDEAEIISYIFNYKLFDDSYSPYLGNICCGFPEQTIRKIKDRLIELNINFNIIDTSDYTYEYYDFEEQNNYQKFYDSIKTAENNEKEENLIKNGQNKNSNIYVEIGDTVSICNTKTNEIETYTIEPTYYTQIPAGFSGERGNNFGKIIYKDELLNNSDLKNGIILSESEFAKRLLGSYLNSALILIDDNLKDCIYKIIDIKKH